MIDRGVNKKINKCLSLMLIISNMYLHISRSLLNIIPHDHFKVCDH